jgi:predicted adenine nucleotide alpha hydrolase (AANH) superfamily ATPase
MRVLLHICCGPCAIMPVRRLLDEGCEVEGFFYNPNIHPLAEYLRRREGAAAVAEKYGLRMHWALEDGDYDTAAWLGRISASGAGLNARERCPVCWSGRLARAFALAEREGFDAVTSSLLYSRRQRHDEIAALGRALAQKHAGAGGPLFLYRDFRPDWRRGIDISKEWGVYRQQYCGCIFSENDRYARALQKADAVLSAAFS